MDIALILFGIKAAIRLGKVTKEAAEQHARDAEALFPDIDPINFDLYGYVTGLFRKADYSHYVAGDKAPYKQHWEGNRPKSDPNSLDALFAAAVKIKAGEGVDLNTWVSDSQKAAGYILIKQWAPGESKPVSPFARVVLVAADIALEYVAVNPGILGVGGNGEKLIGAYAGNLSELLPDDGNFTDVDNFTEQLLGVFLRAGLDTVHKNPQWVVSEKHVQKLITETVKPIREAFPDKITEQIHFQEVTDALIGPAASAAMQVLAEHAEQFLGEDFKAETAMGALTKALLDQAAETGLEDAASTEGLIDLYQAALGVAARRPDLFFDASGNPQTRLAQDMMKNIAAVMKDSPPPFDGRVGGKLAGAALDALSSNAHRFTDPNRPWDAAAAEVFSKLTGDLSAALKANQDMAKVFSTAQLIEIGRIILNHTAATPQMVVAQDEALAQLVGTVAVAMANDPKLLIDGEDWIEIVKVAAAEAAANPGRLFKLDPNDPGQTMAAQLIAVVLRSAGGILENDSLKAKTVLFGKTLREAVIILLRATSGNAAAAEANMVKIEDLITELNELVAKHPDKFGSKEWLYLFRDLLAALLAGKEPGELTVEKAEHLLAGRSQ